MRTHGVAAACLLIVFLGACASVRGDGLRVVPSLESRTLSIANGARREAGLPALAMRKDLVEVARKHALDMAERGYFSHFTPEGESPGTRARDAGVRYVDYAENLARVKRSDRPDMLAVQGWLESPSHRRNLLDERGTGYRYTGIGVARAADGTVHIAQVFLK